jgi:NAD(P)-dependent dehydrogenase (short-subunit alcohol dehydrogenase family)
MNTRIALVTGANKGLGFSMSRKLAQQGIKVLMGGRDISRGKEATQILLDEGLDVAFVQLDVTVSSTIQSTVKEIENQFGKLDILINNAGISGGWDGQLPSQIPLETVRDIFEVNFFAQIAVTQAFLPLLKKSLAGRIVNMTSGLGSLSQNSDPNYRYYGFNTLGYNASKAALNMLTICLAKELQNSSIKVNSADPDWCKTDLGTEAAPNTPEQGTETPVWLATLPGDGPTGACFNAMASVPW